MHISFLSYFYSILKGCFEKKKNTVKQNKKMNLLAI